MQATEALSSTVRGAVRFISRAPIRCETGLAIVPPVTEESSVGLRTAFFHDENRLWRNAPMAFARSR